MVRHVVSCTREQGTRLVQPRWIPERILGGGWTCWCILLFKRTGPPVIKQLVQMVTMVPGQGGRFQSMSFSNNSILFFSFVTEYGQRDAVCNYKLIMYFPRPSHISEDSVIVSLLLFYSY